MKSLKCPKLHSLAKADGIYKAGTTTGHNNGKFPLKEKYMQRLHRYLVSLLLGAALIATVGIQAKESDRNCQDKDNRGYYDRDHKDCHGWDDREDRAYRKWWQAKHKTHREFSKLKAKQQSEYWKWRHEHPDDDDRDRH
jgi:hypothetical protein